VSALRTFPGLRLLRGQSGFAAVVQTGFATVLVLAINVVTGIVSARCLGAQGRGELSALLLCPQFLSFLFAIGLPTAAIVRIKAHPQAAPGLMGAALLLSTGTGILAALAGAVIIPLLTRQYDPYLIRVARALLIFVMLGVPSTVLIAAMQLRNRFIAYNRMRFWQSFLILLSLVTLGLQHAFSPLTGAVAYLLPTLPFFVWNVCWVIREFKPRLVDLRANSRSLLTYGSRVQLLDIGNTFFGQLDKLILVAVLAPATFGLYVVVFNLSRLVATFANSAIAVLLPRAAGKSAEEVSALTSRAFTATALFTVAAVLGFVLVGRIGLRLLYGEQFSAGYVLLVILAVEAALASGAAVLQQSYLALNRPGMVAAFHLASLTLAGVLVYLGARRFGAEGAAVGLLSATCLRFALTYGGFNSLLAMRPPRLLPTRFEVATLLARARARVA